MKHFDLPADKLPVSAGAQRLKAIDGVHSTLVQTMNMLPPDVGAGRAALLSQQANITDNSGTLHCPGKATTVDTARWFIHGTDVQEALRVLYDRSMSSRIDDGPAGEGVYGSTMLDDEDESILEGWTRVRRSGKCINVAFMFEADGLIVHSQEGWFLPAGSA